ncbi:MAG: AAA family ATPase [Candidatus Phocaeicola faecigallinarum]|uniref:AAA family ATPase n=1 Tax=Candidatus Phocaeicola faecigallinarum TaxID=2838732 RepID=A0A948T9U0_9BACT|nr:AAA family ATPase [Candidatus Phocaeicola faecigallinarum]
MQYTHIYINKLFGLYDYKLDFNYENDDKLTILTGPNGYGKTTILTIINKLNPRELFYFYS